MGPSGWSEDVAALYRRHTEETGQPFAPAASQIEIANPIDCEVIPRELTYTTSLTIAHRRPGAVGEHERAGRSPCSRADRADR